MSPASLEGDLQFLDRLLGPTIGLQGRRQVGMAVGQRRVIRVEMLLHQL